MNEYFACYKRIKNLKNAPTKCVFDFKVRGYLLSIGYSLAVGGMFSKTWRVYQIFTNIKPRRKVHEIILS